MVKEFASRSLRRSDDRVQTALRAGHPGSGPKHSHGLRHRVIRDRDISYGAAVTRRLQAMGIRDRPITAHSPWQNGHVERLSSSIRGECLDHVVVLGERHLRHLLANYANYYNGVRTHLALDKDTPLHRPTQAVGRIASVTWLGGFHRHYGFVVGDGAEYAFACKMISLWEGERA